MPELHSGRALAAAGWGRRGSLLARVGEHNAAAVQFGDFRSPQGMLGVAISHYRSAVEFQKSLPGVSAELLVTSPGTFEAKTTSLALPHMFLLRATESMPRIAHVVLPPSPAMISFSLAEQSQMLWNGVAIRQGDLIIHAARERLHQRTSGANSWGLLTVDRDFLIRQSAAVLRKADCFAREGAILRAAPRERGQFLKLHAKAFGFVEARPVQVGHPKVAWELEQDLLYALLQCFRDGERQTPSPTHRFQVAILDRFEVALAARPNQHIALADLCSAIGVSGRKLRACCHAILGMSPTTYMRLCRLTRVRAAIVSAEPRAVCIAELARQFGFTEAGRFSAAYRLAFGELPSATLARP